MPQRPLSSTRRFPRAASEHPVRVASALAAGEQRVAVEGEGEILAARPTA